MSKEINSPLLRETVQQLEEIQKQIADRTVEIPSAVARITAIKHKIQAVALDWLYSRKVFEIDRSTKRLTK